MFLCELFFPFAILPLQFFFSMLQLLLDLLLPLVIFLSKLLFALLILLP